MAVSFGGYRYGSSAANAASVSIDPNSSGHDSGGTACAVGDWMILVITGGSPPVDMDAAGDLAGWTIVRSYSAMTGTSAFQTGVWMKRRTSGETSYDWPLDGTGYAVHWRLMWYSGVETAFAGSFWDRSGHATTTTTIAPAVTSTAYSSLVVSISTERTVAAEVDSSISVNNGMNKRLYSLAGGDQVVNVADKLVVQPGTSGDTTWTYPNPQTYNGLAGHICLTPSSNNPSGAPHIAGVTQGFVMASATLTLNVPSGYQAGDLLVASLRAQTPSSPTDWTNAAFTRVGPAFTASSALTRVTGFYTHVVTGTEPASYTFAVGAAARAVGALYIVRNADPSWVSFYDSTTGDAITNGRTIPSYAANDPSLVLDFAASEFVANTDHTPSNYPDNFATLAEVVTTGSYTSTSRTYMWSGARQLYGGASTAGPTDTDIAWAGVPSAPVALSIAFRPPQSTIADFTAKIGDTNGTLSDVVIRVGDTGGVLSKVSGIRAMLPRYSSVSDMLAQDEFFWAHRGGSLDYPEMSLFAYGQSALQGYGCLELSLARTSDGVWFGLHDANLNRTSGATGLAAASTMTWAQVQAYSILGSLVPNNPSQPDRAYAKLQDILDTYSQHLFIVDVKYESAHLEELINILDTYGGPERFIGKAFGIGSTAIATSFANHGYQRWGYFFSHNIASLTTEYVNMWTLLGMDYTSPQSDWNTLMSYRTNNQRLIGATCPDDSSVISARSKGATGFMVSGVSRVRST